MPGSLESIGIGAFGWTFPKYLDDYLLECDGPTRLRMEENSGPYEVVNDCLIERKRQVQKLADLPPLQGIRV